MHLFNLPFEGKSAAVAGRVTLGVDTAGAEIR